MILRVLEGVLKINEGSATAKSLKRTQVFKELTF